MGTLCLKIPYSNNIRPDREIESLEICSETPMTAQLGSEARIAMLPSKSWYKLRYSSNALSIIHPNSCTLYQIQKDPSKPSLRKKTQSSIYLAYNRIDGKALKTLQFLQHSILIIILQDLIDLRRIFNLPKTLKRADDILRVLLHHVVIDGSET